MVNNKVNHPTEAAQRASQHPSIRNNGALLQRNVKARESLLKSNLLVRSPLCLPISAPLAGAWL